MKSAYGRLGVVSLVVGLGSGACGPNGEVAGARCDSRPWHTRWVWDTVYVRPVADGASETVLAPNQRVCRVRGTGSEAMVLIGTDTLGYVPNRALHRQPLPDDSAAYLFATLAAERELSFPHTALFPPLDSARVRYGGAGRYEVVGTVSANDGWDRRHTVPWRVALHRMDYRWVVDSVWVETASPRGLMP